MTLQLTKILDRLVFPTRALIVFAIGAALAQSVYFFVFGPQTLKSDVALVTSDSMQTTAAEIDKIISSNLFGREQSSVERLAPIADTKLNMLLVSVLWNSDNPDQSIAWIAYANSDPKKYQIGDTVAGVAGLLEIQQTQVVLRRAGKPERLVLRVTEDWIQEVPNSGAATTNNARQPASMQSRSQADDTTTRLLRAAQDQSRRSHDGDPNRAELIFESVKDRLDEDPVALLNEWGMVPVSQSDAEGYMVSSALVRKGLDRVGIQAGDVLLSVNGSPIGDVERDRSELIEKMRGATARVEVQRGQRKFFINVTLD